LRIDEIAAFAGDGEDRRRSERPVEDCTQRDSAGVLAWWAARGFRKALCAGGVLPLKHWLTGKSTAGTNTVENQRKTP
jgi:hypothetical protein